MSKVTTIQIHYWSSTGNTKLAAELAAESLRETGAKVTLTDIRTITKCRTKPETASTTSSGKTSRPAGNESPAKTNGPAENKAPAKTNRPAENGAPPKTETVTNIEPCDLWVIAAPVHDFKMAIVVEEFLSTVKLSKNQKVAAIFTCAGFEDRTPLQLSKILKKKGASPWDWQTLICEDSWPVARNYLPFICSWEEPSLKRRELFKAWWRAVPGRLADNDVGRSFWRIPTPLTPLSFLLCKSLIKHTFPLYIDPNKCTKCKACEDQCPTGRIIVDNFPETPGECVACYGCINVCEADAIDTWLTKGAKRYKGPKSG